MRLWLLLVLTLVGAFAPSRAHARTAENRTWDFFATTTNVRPETAAQVAGTHQGFAAFGYELASGYPQAAESGTFRTWNQFQRGTAGQFASRAEAGQAWSAYKSANGIVTGAPRSIAARSGYLRSLADDWRTPSWQRPFLQDGRVPPGFQVDHIKPLSIGGADAPFNMRLQSTELHRIHHQFYDPWNW